MLCPCSLDYFALRLWGARGRPSRAYPHSKAMNRRTVEIRRFHCTDTDPRNSPQKLSPSRAIRLSTYLRTLRLRAALAAYFRLGYLGSNQQTCRTLVRLGQKSQIQCSLACYRVWYDHTDSKLSHPFLAILSCFRCHSMDILSSTSRCLWGNQYHHRTQPLDLCPIG